MKRLIRTKLGGAICLALAATPFLLDEIAQTHLYPTPGTGMLMAMGAGTDIVRVTGVKPSTVFT